MQEGNTVASVEKAAALLMLFGGDESTQELSIQEIATQLGVPKTTAHRLTTTLVGQHFLEQNKENKKYLLGLSTRILGDRYLKSHNLERVLPVHLKMLVQMFGESVSAAVMLKTETMIYEKLDGNHALRVTTQIGNRNPLHCTGSGKVFLSSMPPEECEALLYSLVPLRAYTPHTITDVGALLENIGDLRQRGYAFDSEEIHLGQTCISAPVFGSDGHVCVAITVSGPKERINRKGVDVIGSQLRDYCMLISRELGFVSSTEETLRESKE